jgi:hypothetical protein
LAAVTGAFSSVRQRTAKPSPFSQRATLRAPLAADSSGVRPPVLSTPMMTAALFIARG